MSLNLFCPMRKVILWTFHHPCAGGALPVVLALWWLGTKQNLTRMSRLLQSEPDWTDCIFCFSPLCLTHLCEITHSQQGSDSQRPILWLCSYPLQKLSRPGSWKETKHGPQIPVELLTHSFPFNAGPTKVEQLVLQAPGAARN